MCHMREDFFSFEQNDMKISKFSFNAQSMTSGNLKRKQLQDQNETFISDTCYEDNKKFKMGHTDRFFLAFQLVTCGLQNNDLGRDETAILQIGFQLINASTNQVVGGKIILLQASSLLDPSADPDKIHISVPAREMTELLSSPSSYSLITLQQSLDEIDNCITNTISNINGQSIEVIPITIGHLPLRSVLHRESRFRNLTLKPYWYHYYDLCDQVYTFCGLQIYNLDGICNALHMGKPGRTTSNIIWNMTTVILHLLHSGHVFHSKHLIKNSYKPLVFHVDDHIEPEVVVMIKPIDYRTPISEVIPFFRGLNIAAGGIAVVMAEGRRSNKILVKFEDKLQRDIALLRDKHHMEPGNTRFITISVCESKEFTKIAGYQDENVKTYLQRIQTPDQILVRIKGLPYTVSKEEILNFFNSNDVKIQFSYDGIFLVQKPSGDLNGDAFLIFESEAIAQKAKNLKGMTIGNRYMEIFYSTPPEMNQVIVAVNKGIIKSKKTITSIKNNDSITQNYLNQSALMDSTIAGTITKFIPNEATDSDFLNFISDYQKLCIKVSRSNLYSSQNYISYMAFFKSSSDADMVVKGLCNKTLKIASLNREVPVETIKFPLLNQPDEKQSLTSQLYQKAVTNNVPINNYLNTLPNMLAYPSLLVPQSVNFQNSLNLANLNGSLINYGGISNIYSGNNPISLVPNSNLFMVNQIPYSLPLTTGTNIKFIPRQDLINNSIQSNVNFSNCYQNLSTTSSSENKSKILYICGAVKKILQQDLDNIFHSIASNISVLPKLLQHDQFCYAVFNSTEDANVALQRCPIILYNNQVIQLIPTLE